MPATLRLAKRFQYGTTICIKSAQDWNHDALLLDPWLCQLINEIRWEHLPLAGTYLDRTFVI